MALFARKDKKTAAKSAVVANQESKHVAAVSKVETTRGGSDLAHILRNPRITEKASSHMGLGIYAFDVSDSATKKSIAHAVHALYNVRPRRVNVVTVPQKIKRSTRTGQRGTTGGGKKAYVYLNKGESITLT